MILKQILKWFIKKYYNSRPFGLKNLGIPKNGSIEEDGITIEWPHLKRFKAIIILIKGIYTDSHGENSQPFDIIGIFDLVSKDFGNVSQPFDDSVREILKRKKIIN